MTGTALATVDRKGITALLETEDAKKRITPLLFNGIEYAQIVAETQLAVAENPEILQCTPASVVRAVARACSWGLIIGETVHLVPFNVNIAKKGQDPQFEKRLKAIQDYKGKIELIVNAGGARSIDAEVVYAKELFEYEKGSDPYIKHRPATNPAERGPMIGAYAVAHHGFNRKPHLTFMALSEIDAIRQKHSKQWKTGACPPWYAKKTCVHQIAKLLPKNPRMAKVMRVLEQDDDLEELNEPGPVATIEAPATTTTAGTESFDSRCICDHETGEQDPNCPIHGDFASEA